MAVVSKRLVILFSCLLLASCASLEENGGGGLTRAHRRREGQARWVDERSVIESVAMCVTASDMPTGFHASRRKYAEVLRHWYFVASDGYADVDGGIRALNFIKKIHRDAEGGKSLWRDAVKLARDPQETGIPGKPIPAEYR